MESRRFFLWLNCHHLWRQCPPLLGEHPPGSGETQSEAMSVMSEAPFSYVFALKKWVGVPWQEPSSISSYHTVEYVEVDAMQS